MVGELIGLIRKLGSPCGHSRHPAHMRNVRSTIPVGSERTLRIFRDLDRLLRPLRRAGPTLLSRKYRMLFPYDRILTACRYTTTIRLCSTSFSPKSRTTTNEVRSQLRNVCSQRSQKVRRVSRVRRSRSSARPKPLPLRPKGTHLVRFKPLTVREGFN